MLTMPTVQSIRSCSIKLKPNRTAELKPKKSARTNNNAGQNYVFQSFARKITNLKLKLPLNESHDHFFKILFAFSVSIFFIKYKSI